MISHETELKLQAYLDGELSTDESGAAGEAIGRDPELRALIDELNATRELLAGHEAEVQVPESREFYWSQIRRRIESGEKQRDTDPSKGVASAWWMRILAPAGMLGALAVFLAVALKQSETPSGVLAMSESHEIETPLEETSSFSFRSETAAMTVVWVDSHRE